MKLILLLFELAFETNVNAGAEEFVIEQKTREGEPIWKIE